MSDNNSNNPAEGEGVDAKMVDEVPHVSEAGTQGTGDGVAAPDKGKAPMGSAPPGSSEPPGPVAQEGSAAGPSRLPATYKVGDPITEELLHLLTENTATGVVHALVE
ncbi:hypothetical protein WJX79_009865 [Trebouxia sp. C0005]